MCVDPALTLQPSWPRCPTATTPESFITKLEEVRTKTHILLSDGNRDGKENKRCLTVWQESVTNCPYSFASSETETSAVLQLWESTTNIFVRYLIKKILLCIDKDEDFLNVKK